MEGWEFTGLHVIVVLLLLIVCANVAILVYARTVTRRGEIALRTALGARRTRVVCQLFMEAFVLSAAASVLGLVIAAIALRQADAVIEPLPFAPFWIEFGLSARTVSFVSLLALTGALIVGVVPGLKATGRRMPVSLQRIAAGVSAMSLGRTWTALVVTQVAFTVMALPPSVQFTALLLRSGFADAGFAAENVLSARLLVDREIPPSAERETSEIEFTRRYASLQSELIRRVEAEPGISAVTWSVQLPGGEPSLRVEVESTEATTRPESASRAHYSQVASGLLDTFGVPVTAGRSFTAADIGAANGALIVNGAFVRELLGGSNAIGRRLRFTEGYRSNRVMRYPAGVEPDRWYEIIGVVGEFPVSSGSGVVEPAVFAPMAPGQTWPVRIHIGSRDASPSVLTARVREIASDIDGDLRLVDLGPLDEAIGQARTGFRLGALGIGLVMLCVVVLAAAGLHALMSFTVSQRQREIGIRLALGAAPRALLGSIFARALRQLAIGVAAGVTVFTLIDFGMNGQIVTAESAVLVAAVAVFMVVIGLLAAAGPARRGLRIQPTEALREER
jgi:predicted permease